MIIACGVALDWDDKKPNCSKKEYIIVEKEVKIKTKSEVKEEKATEKASEKFKTKNYETISFQGK